jgi:FKBP-type peptidyl-prolyl cis-trans isomerase FkpA
MRNLILFISGILTLTACGNDGFKGEPGGLEYKIHHQTGNPPPEKGDIIEMHMVMKHGDSVFSDSRQTGPVFMVMDDPAFRGDILEGLAKTGKGDSATFRVSADSLYGDFLPSFMEKGSFMQFHVRINDIRNETDRITNFIYNEGLNMTIGESGVYYEFLERGEGAYPNFGDTVVTIQEGRLLDGTVFESTGTRGRPSEMIYGIRHPIEGWDVIISKMRVGDKARFIVPYRLGYKEGGSADGVPPFATLYFEVELLDIKRRTTQP